MLRSCWLIQKEEKYLLIYLLNLSASHVAFYIFKFLKIEWVPSPFYLPFYLLNLYGAHVTIKKLWTAYGISDNMEKYPEFISRMALFYKRLGHLQRLFQTVLAWKLDSDAGVFIFSWKQTPIICLVLRYTACIFREETKSIAKATCFALRQLWALPVGLTSI